MRDEVLSLIYGAVAVFPPFSLAYFCNKKNKVKNKESAVLLTSSSPHDWLTGTDGQFGKNQILALVQYPHSTPIVLTRETKVWEDTRDCQGNKCTECRMGVRR